MMMMTTVITGNICTWPLKHSSKQQQAAAGGEQTGQDRCGVDDGDGDAGSDPGVHLPKVQLALLDVHCRQHRLPLDHQLHWLASAHLHQHLRMKFLI